jgi:hypothetical protein
VKQLPVQLHTGHYPLDPASFRRPVNRGHKPSCGLWSSSYHRTRRSAWVRWCEQEEFHVPALWQGTLFQPASCRVYTIDHYRDLELLARRFALPQRLYPTITTDLDFEAMLAEFDAAHLTERGQRETHLLAGIDADYSLNGWDCESVLWLRFPPLLWQQAIAFPSQQTEEPRWIQDESERTA